MKTAITTSRRLFGGGSLPIEDVGRTLYSREMPALLHEYWENETGGEFTVVRERADEIRPTLTPGAQFLFEVWASSWQEAMQARNRCLCYGPYEPADDVPDHFYTLDEAEVQSAYLQRRTIR